MYLRAAQPIAPQSGLSHIIPSQPSKALMLENAPVITLRYPLPTYRTKLPPQTSESAILYWSINAGKIERLTKYPSCKHLTNLGPATPSQYPTYLNMSVAGNLDISLNNSVISLSKEIFSAKRHEILIEQG